MHGDPPAPRSLTRDSLLAGAVALARRHPVFASLLRRHGPPPLWARRPGFATLVRIVLEQQVSLAAARTMYLRLADALGGVTPRSVAQARAEGLRALGLTRQKAGYIHGLAGAVLEDRLDLGAIARRADPEGRAALLAMPGLGPWSVDIYYLMALRRPDVWPRGDLALAHSLQRVLELSSRPGAEAQLALAAQWAPWRSVAARLLWQAYLSN